MKSKKSFKLDKDVHTQIVLDDIDSLILGKPKYILKSSKKYLPGNWLRLMPGLYHMTSWSGFRPDGQ